MPYYANAGEAFWGSANSGAKMASKWIDAYDWSDKYQHESAFKEGSANAMDAYNKSIKDAEGIQDEGQRQKAIQDATELRNNTLTKLALEHQGYKGVDTANKFIVGSDASDENVSNASWRDYTRNQFNQNPNGAWGNGSSVGGVVADAIFGMSKNSDEPTIQGLMQTFGITNQGGALYMNDGDQDLPINMQLLASRLNWFPALSDSYNAWMGQ